MIALQPVKIINWDGTYDGAEAHMKFWFFGWKDFKVTHGENRSEKNLFSFKDIGSVLPFGLSKWEHTHIVLKKENNVEIVDELSLPPVKIHCSVLAEDAIKAAIEDYKKNKE